MSPSVRFHPVPEPCARGVDVLVIAGEPSGDELAAPWVASLLERNPELSVYALGGPELRKAGAQLLYDTTVEAAVVGFWDVLVKYPFFRSLFSKTLDWIKLHRPKTIVLVDYPGFNLRLAKALYEEGLTQKAGGQMRLLYYIAPQVWAWKPKRRFEMARWLDGLAVLFPFEVQAFQDTQLPVTYVGHPYAQADASASLLYNKQAPLLLLPGSRLSAIDRIYPRMLEAFRLYLQQHDAKAQAISIAPNESVRAALEVWVRRFGLQDHVSFRLSGNKVFGRAVLVSAGTMSLRSALAGIPGALVYVAHPFTYALGRCLLRIPYLGMASIVLGKPVYPEYLQAQAAAQTLCQALYQAQQDSTVEAMQADTRQLRAALTQPGALGMADWVLSGGGQAAC
jgi:lipid-A-disaccharide synthase